MQRIKEELDKLDAGDIALIVVIVVGYVVGVATGFAGAWPSSTIAIVLVTFVMTAVYLGLARWADQYFERYQSSWTTFAYFAIQMTLVLLTITLLGPGAWLISLPLAALAVNHLAHWWQRWIIYLGILFGLAVPFLRDGRWQEAFLYALTLSPAILFVVVFSNLVNSEQEARRDAEALAAELEEANHQLALYSTQVAELARTKERNRLAREIHDNLGHYLTVVNVQIRAAQAVMASDPGRAQAALDNAQRLTKDGLDAVRHSVAALRESPLGSRSLAGAMEDLADETRSSGIVVNIELLGEALALDPKTELTLYRAAQEGLTNVRKHARATQVDVSLDYGDSLRIKLRIADNGAGLEPHDEGGYGLLGIQERVELLGGTMDAGSVPGEGFILSISVPRSQATVNSESAVPGNA